MTIGKLNIERMLELYKKNYKRLIIGALLLIFVFTIGGCAKSTEGLVAEVDGDGITQEEFDSDYEVFKRIYEKQLGEDALSQVGPEGITLGDTLKTNIIEKLIMEKLVANETKNMNIVVTDEEVNNQLEQYIAIMEGQEKFEEFLKTNEITQEFFKENLRKELLVNKHRESFIQDATITDKDAKEYYEANKEDLVIVKASHILLASEEEGKKVLERLKTGEEFATLALTESMDTVSAAQGGSLGYFTRGNMIAEFEDVAFSLKEGETSELIQTEVGYHIIYLEDRKDTFEDLKVEIINVLKEEKYLDKIQELRDKSKVKIYNEEKTSK